MTDTTISRGSLSIGRVFRLAFSAMQANAATFGMLALLFAFLPAVLFGVIRLNMGIPEDDLAAQVRGVPGENVVTAVLNLILIIGVTHGSVRHFKGGRASLSQSLGASSNFLGLFGLLMVMNIAILIGLILLILPGIILWAMWTVALPAKIEEKLSIGEALGRSAALTKDKRGAIIALSLIWVLSCGAVFVVVSMIIGIFVPFGPAFDLVFELCVTPLLVTALALLSASISAALYYELKRIKEGDATIAAVFD